MTDRSRGGPVILLIFVLSGAAALIDEIVWSRQLVLVFGNTTQAVSAILAGFFGGIALGSFAGGRIADRVRAPLRMYGLLELALAVVVVLTPISFRLINGLYRDIYPSLEGSPQALAVLRVAMAVLALAPATILMGATLPTLTRYLARGVTLSGAFSRLYAANTVGAIVARRSLASSSSSCSDCLARWRSGPAARPSRGSRRCGSAADALPSSRPPDRPRPLARRPSAAPPRASPSPSRSSPA